MDIHPHNRGAHEGPSRFPLWQRVWKRGCLWVAALAGVLFVLLHGSLFGGKGLVPADGVLNYPPWNSAERPSNYLLADQCNVFVPQHEFMHQRFLLGEFPLWNPYLGCGVPNLASMQGGLLSPIQLFLLPIDPFYASGLAAFLKLFLTGVFTFAYLRLLGASHAAAFLSGMVFSLCGFMIVWLGHPHINCAMWFPLLLYFVEKTFRSESPGLFTAAALRSWVGLAVTFGFVFLGGHLPTAIHLMIGVTIYFVFRLSFNPKKQPFRRLALLASALVAGLFVAAPQIVPYLEYYRQSSSGVASDALNRWATHLAPGALIHFLLPNISGNPAVGFEDLPRLLGLGAPDNFNECTGYVGILPLFLAFYAACRRRCRFTVFYSCATVGSMLFVLGVPPLPALIRAVPILCDINQTRLLLFTSFSVAVLAGLGWDTLSREESRLKGVWIAMGFFGVIAAVLLWLWNAISPGFHGLDPGHRTFLVRQFLVLLGGVVASGVLVLQTASRERRLAGTICLCWTAFDLLWFGMGYNPSIPRDHYYPRAEAIQWLQKDPSVFRVFGGGVVLAPNTAPVFGLSDARGYDFMSVRRYEELITGSAGNFFFYRDANSFPKGFQLLNVKYVLLPKPLPLNPELFQLVYSNEIAIYRNTACRERALAVLNYQVDSDPASVLLRVHSRSFDPAAVLMLEKEPESIEPSHGTTSAASDVDSSATISSYKPDEVTIEASSPQPGFVLLLDTYFPEWSARVNGHPAQIYRADYNFRAVAIPSGKSTVCFSYRPMSLFIGGALSAMSLLTMGAACFLPRTR
jgi:hypothetical protein